MDAGDDLIARAQRGDRRAMDALLQQHERDVTRIAFRFIGPDGDLEDVVQEAFIQLFRSLGSFRGQAKFSTWLYRVVSNVAKMHIRARRVRPQLASPGAQEQARAATATLVPEDDVDRRDRIRALYAHATTLSEKKRTVWVLHDLEGLSPVEIAEIVDAPVLTVRTRLFYARKALYTALGEDPLFAEVQLPAIGKSKREPKV